jgi:hypothetical protein
MTAIARIIKASCNALITICTSPACRPQPGHQQIYGPAAAPSGFNIAQPKRPDCHRAATMQRIRSAAPHARLISQKSVYRPLNARKRPFFRAFVGRCNEEQNAAICHISHGLLRRAILPAGPFEQSQQSLQQLIRRRRAAANMQIDGNHVGDSAYPGVAARKNAAVECAIAHCCPYVVRMTILPKCAPAAMCRKAA